MIIPMSTWEESPDVTIFKAKEMEKSVILIIRTTIKVLDLKENPNNDRSLLTIVKGKNVRVFRPGKKAFLDQIIKLNRKLLETNKSHQLIGISMKSKRLGKKESKSNF